MEKVFLVTSGQYSDYHVDGVFSTMEKAEQFTQKFGPHGDQVVEEFLLDEAVKCYLRFVFYFSEEGDVEGYYYDKYDREHKQCEVIEMNHNNLMVKVSAESYREALKIASEKRMIYLEEKRYEKRK